MRKKMFTFFLIGIMAVCTCSCDEKEDGSELFLYEEKEQRSDNPSVPSEGHPTFEATTPERYTFLNVTYRNEELGCSFTLCNPDNNGCPTEILLEGNISSDVSIDNESFELSELSISLPYGYYYIRASFYVSDTEWFLEVQNISEGTMKVYLPETMSGDYYSE